MLATCFIQPSADWAASIDRLVEGIHPADVWLQTDDLKNLSVTETKSLRQFAVRTPVGTKKLAILRGADGWTPQVANSLLKLLEEPPTYLEIIIFSQTSRLLPTVRSRVMVNGTQTTSDPWGNLLTSFKPITTNNAEEVHSLLFLQALTHAGHDLNRIVRSLQPR